MDRHTLDKPANSILLFLYARVVITQRNEYGLFWQNFSTDKLISDIFFYSQNRLPKNKAQFSKNKKDLSPRVL